jgi:uncharacterized protein
VRFDAPDSGASFSFTCPEDLELVGPKRLRLYAELAAGDDAHLFAAVRKLAGARTCRSKRSDSVATS